MKQGCQMSQYPTVYNLNTPAYLAAASVTWKHFCISLTSALRSPRRPPKLPVCDDRLRNVSVWLPKKFLVLSARWAFQWYQGFFCNFSKMIFTKGLFTCAIEEHPLRNLNNYLNTNIYSYLETFGGQSSNLYLSVAHFSTPVLIRHLLQLKTLVFMHWCLICGVILDCPI